MCERDVSVHWLHMTVIAVITAASEATTISKHPLGLGGWSKAATKTRRSSSGKSNDSNSRIVAVAAGCTSFRMKSVTEARRRGADRSGVPRAPYAASPSALACHLYFLDLRLRRLRDTELGALATFHKLVSHAE